MLSFALLLSLLVFSCDKYTLENEKVSGAFTWTQVSFTPTEFDANGTPIKAKNRPRTQRQSSKTISQISATPNIDFDLVTGTSGVVISVFSDKDGDQITTSSSSVSNPTGLLITETITGGTGKFEGITGSGTYPVALDFIAGNGTGTLEWTVTY